MVEGLYQISRESKGLRGFVGNLGRELEKELVEQFNGRVKEHSIDVKYNGDSFSDFFELLWLYKGTQYDFSGKFFLQKPSDSFELTIDRFPGVGIYSNSNLVYPRASPTELRIAADIEEVVKGFLDERFGESISTRGNGCPIYKTNLPEELRSKVA